MGVVLRMSERSAHWRMQVTRRNLEQLRTIKTRMVRLFTKVETIRELLERLLDDDDDMRDMNLTAKCAINAQHRGPLV